MRTRRRRCSTPARAWWYDGYQRARIIRREHEQAMNALMTAREAALIETDEGPLFVMPAPMRMQ
jgi:hypothetical protein